MRNLSFVLLGIELLWICGGHAGPCWFFHLHAFYHFLGGDAVHTLFIRSSYKVYALVGVYVSRWCMLGSTRPCRYAVFSLFFGMIRFWGRRWGGGGVPPPKVLVSITASVRIYPGHCCSKLKKKKGKRGGGLRPTMLARDQVRAGAWCTLSEVLHVIFSKGIVARGLPSEAPYE